MGIDVTGYIEARINGKWHCIDFHQRDTKGQFRLIPCITRRSTLAGVLEDDCVLQRLAGPPDNLSDEVQRLNTSEDGAIYGTGEWIGFRWFAVQGEWFKRTNLSLPEYCGFFSRQSVVDYLSHISFISTISSSI